MHVGVGGRGEWPLRLCKPGNGFISVGLCDSSAERLKAAQKITGLNDAASFTDIDEAIEKSKADCIIICSPTDTHVSFAKKGFEAGLAVLTEKGMAPDWDSALDVVAAARQRKAIYCVAQNYRYRKVEQLISKILTDDRHPFHPGKVFLCDYIEHRVRPHPRNFTYPFASIWDMSCHHMDNLLFWFGHAESITGFSYAAPWSKYEHDNNTSAFMTLSNGVHVNYVHTHDASRASLLISFQGEQGTLSYENQRISFSKRPSENFGVEKIESMPVEETESGSELGVLSDFYNYATEGIEPGISGYKNLNVMAMCQMFVKSIQEKRTVSDGEYSINNHETCLSGLRD